MSKARFDTGAAPPSSRQVLVLLKEAQAIVDTFGRPDIGARLQEVIDSVTELRCRPAKLG